MDKTGPTLAYYVYMLRCSDGSYYVGHTNDLEQRLAAHERGAIEGYTLSRRPVELVFSDRFSTRQEAFHRERQISRLRAIGMGWWNYPTEVVDRPSFDRLRMMGKGLRMRGRGAVLRQAQDDG